MREAESAIQMLNNFDMGSGVRLVVKVSERKEDRDKRLAKKRAEEEFLSTLNCGKYTAKEEKPAVKNCYELTEYEMQHCKTSPFLPTYKPRDPTPRSPQDPGGSQEDGGEHKGAGGFSLGGSGGALSLQASFDAGKPAVPSSSSSELKNCTMCGKLCKLSCQRCKAPYCGRECQSRDWKSHKAECRGPSTEEDMGRKPGSADPREARGNSELVIREKEHSEDEGFDIPTPPMEELMDVLQQKPVSCEKTQPAKAHSTGGVSKPPTHQHSAGGRTPLSLPIVSPNIQTQSLNYSVSSPVSPSNPQTQSLNHSPVSHSNPQTQSLNHSPVSHSNPQTQSLNHSPVSPSNPQTQSLNHSPVSHSNPQTQSLNHSPVSHSNPQTQSLNHSPVSHSNPQTQSLNHSPVSHSNPQTQSLNHSPVSHSNPQTQSLNHSPVSHSNPQTQSLNHSVSSPVSHSNPPPPTIPTRPVAVLQGSKPNAPSEVLKVFQSPGPPLPSLPLGCQPPKRFKAVVTSTLSGTRFSSVLMSVEVKQALKCIADCADSGQLLPADPYNLVVGSKVGFVDDNGELYRMEVRRMHMGNDSIELCFHDFGGSIRTSYSRHSLVTLPEQVVTIPCLRYRCGLPTLQCKDHQGGEHLNSIVRNCAVQMTTLSQQVTSTNFVYYLCAVQLPDGRELEPLMARFLETAPTPRGDVPPNMFPPLLSNSSPTFKPPVPQPPKTSNLKLMYMAKDVSVRPVPSETVFMVVPQVVDSPYSIWAHIIHPQLGALSRLQEYLKREYGGREGKGQVYSPRVGELCVVKHCQDQQYYRAEVTCINNNGTADVRFVDYGQREMILLSQVQHIEPVFLTLPLQAVHFSLVGVAPSGHALSWADDAIAYLKNKILNKKLDARLVSTSRQEIHSVTLSVSANGGKSVVEEMVNNGWCVRSYDMKKDTSAGKMAGVKMVLSPDAPKSPASSPPPLFTPSSFPQPVAPPSQTAPHGSSAKETVDKTRENGSPSTNFFSPQAGAKKEGGSLCRASEVKVPGINLPVNVDVEVLVTSVMSPLQFHVQPLEKESLNTLKEISNNLNSTTLAPFPPGGEFPMFCAARFSEDKMVHRARIWKQSNRDYLVRFIDYGNSESVPQSDVYILPVSCAELPAQAVFCGLNGHYPVIQTPDKQTSKQCSQDFRSLVENREVVISTNAVLDTFQYRYPKHIVDLRDKNGKDALRWLVEAGHAKDERISPRMPKKTGGGGKRPGSAEGGGGKRGMGKGGWEGGPKKEGGRRSGGGGGGGGWKKRGNENEGSPSKPWGDTATSPTKSSPFGGGGFGSRENDIESENTAPGNAANGETAAASPVRPSPSQEPTAITTESIAPKPTEPPPPDYPPVSTLARTELPSDMEFMEVVITSFADLPNFYVHLATEQSHHDLSMLLDELNSGTLPAPSSHPPLQGQVVVCKYAVDNVWYRASVVGTHSDKFVVKFIDYGNEEVVPLANIVPCPPELLKQPVLSVKCTLQGVFPPPPSYRWSPEAASFLQQYCERTLLARLESRDALSGTPSVHLVDSSGPEEISIAVEMVRAGLAAPSPPPTPKTPPTEPSPTTSTAIPPSSVKKDDQSVKYLSRIKIPRENEFEVLVLSVSSFTDVFIHPVSPETPHYISTFMNSISEFCFAQTTPPATPPPIGHYCLALFDGSWYRAKVESFDSAHSNLGVFFVDYGNRETVRLTQIRSMPAQFTDVPMLVLKCALYGIEPRAALEPDPAILALFSQLATSSKLKCRVVSYQPLLVDLIDPATSCSLRDKLGLSPLPPTALFSVETSSLGEGGKSQVQVTEVYRPNDFWLQSVESPNLYQLNPLMEKIHSHCLSASPSHPPVLGELSCAKFSEDKTWYRARVIGFPSLSQCKVRFLDYGNCEVCEVSTVVPATEELLQLPALAIHCTLEGQETTGEGGEREDGGGGDFKVMVENQILAVEEKGWGRGQAVVALTGPNGPIKM